MAMEVSAVQPVSGLSPASLAATRASPAGGTSVSGAPDVGLTFEVNRETGAMIIRVVDRETHEVIREIPPEETQRLQAAIRRMVGLVFDRSG